VDSNPVLVSHETLANGYSRRSDRWILKHLDNIEERSRYVQPRQWVSGESMLHLSRRCVLKVINDPSQRKVTCKLIRGQLRGHGVELNATKIEKAVRQWYREKALDTFQRKLDRIIEALPWTKASPAWRMMDMQTQWGSCSLAGTLLLNRHLIKAPSRAIDYVLLHELCHLVEHNHSARFYGLLDRLMPDWRSVKEQLDGQSELFLR
jgi:predicted metal-dependent hydrolase